MRYTRFCSGMAESSGATPHGRDKQVRRQTSDTDEATSPGVFFCVERPERNEPITPRGRIVRGFAILFFSGGRAVVEFRIAQSCEFVVFIQRKRVDEFRDRGVCELRRQRRIRC